MPPTRYTIEVPPGFRYDRIATRLDLQAKVNLRFPSPTGAWQHTWQPSADGPDRYIITAVPPLPYPAPFPATLRRPGHLPVGLSHGGQMVWWPYTREGTIHGLLAGQTGAGKTTCAQGIVVAALLCPFERVTILDPKQGPDWAWLAGYPPVTFAASLPDMTDALADAERRRAERSRQQMAAAAELRILAPFPPELVYVDEASSLFTLAKGAGKAKADDQLRADCRYFARKIAQEARSANIHLLVATQRPRADYFDSDLKFNLAFRVGLGELDGTAARMIFDTADAAQDQALDDVAPPVARPGHGYCRPGAGLVELQAFAMDIPTGLGLLGRPPAPVQQPDEPAQSPRAPVRPVPSGAGAPPTDVLEWGDE
jgi:DNA segregation ATPase FtsK/SpoIIIE-like protein